MHGTELVSVDSHLLPPWQLLAVTTQGTVLRNHSNDRMRALHAQRVART